MAATQYNISAPYYTRHVAGLSTSPPSGGGPFGWQPPPQTAGRPRLDLPTSKPSYRGPITPPLSSSPHSAGAPSRLPSPSPRSPTTPPWSNPSHDDKRARLRSSASTNSLNHNRRSPLGFDAQYLIPEASGYDERFSSNSLHSLDIDWTHEVPSDVPSHPIRTYDELDLQWTTIFDARDHRIPVMKATWFQDDWEVAGVYENHILFIAKEEKKRRVQIYNITDDSLHLVETKYEAAGLSFDGKYLLVTYKGVISMLDCKTDKVIKKYKAKDLYVRKWTSNDRGFCWVDNEGTFWRWSFESSGDPEQVFKLQASAPRYWLTPITTRDGSWYAICATEQDRRKGVVHCYPEDNGEARVFEGPSAGAFTYVDVDGKEEVAVILLSVVNEKRGSHVAFDMYGISRSSRLQRHGQASVTMTQSMKLLPEMFLDPTSSLVLIAISTASTDGSLCMIFDQDSGACVASRRINMDSTDRIHCGSGSGMHLEHQASIFRRLVIYPEGLPRPDSAGTGAAPMGLADRRRSFESWRSDDYGSNSASSQHNAAVTTEGTSLHSGSAKSPLVTKDAAGLWGRGFVMGATDESWMLGERQKKKR